MTFQDYALPYSVRRYLLDKFLLRQLKMLSPKIKVIDIGGLKSKKRSRFDINHFDLFVTYVNLNTKFCPDTQADAVALPHPNSSFEVAICCELLEHVPDPRAVIKETYRILRPSGRVLITVPFLYPIHGDPYDYGRYTDHYWHSVLEEVGFQDISIERQGLYYSVMVNFLKLYANRRWRTPIRQLLSWPLGFLQWWAFKREESSQVQSDPFLGNFTTGFGVVAFK